MQEVLRSPGPTRSYRLGEDSWVRIVTVEETPDTIYLVLPSTSMAGGEGGALSDQELQSVAGAGTWGAETCGSVCLCVEGRDLF